MTMKYKTEVAVIPLTFRGTKCQETQFPLHWNSSTQTARSYKYKSFFFNGNNKTMVYDGTLQIY